MVRIGIEHQDAIDIEVARAIARGVMPGCVVAVGGQDGLWFRRSYGWRSLEPSRTPMTLDTIFDLASLTKPVATATSVLILAERGAVRLDDPVSRSLPRFAAKGKAAITIRDLLTHTGGLPAANPLGDYRNGPERAMDAILDVKPVARRGRRLVYTDVGFIVLGELVRAVSGKDLATFTTDNVFLPLGMGDTRFRLASAQRARAAPTTKREGRWLRGEVHDPRAHGLGGVAGHAGLFSTAGDLALFARMLLAEGELGGARVLSAKSVRALATPHEAGRGVRGLGWKMLKSSRSGFSARSIGHAGFTGTSLWIDPEQGLFVVFLSNRLHPDGKGNVHPTATAVRKVAVEAAKTVAPLRLHASPVLTGLDVLRRDGFEQLAGARVGLITNVSGRARDGARSVDLLARTDRLRLIKLFSLEHGLGGRSEGAVADGRDPITGLVVHSLFGKNERPTAKSLEGIDTLVFDVQDVGVRFYTYLSTMRRAMEAAAAAKLAFVVLDRPNPLGGAVVSGPLQDADARGFVHFHRLPVRHGMTAGEIARLLMAERRIDVRLRVVEVEGWRREALWSSTDLPWVSPSPNLRSPSAALLYPGLGLLERTNLSVGRGTPTPFELFGAPWIDSGALVAALSTERIVGARFERHRFTPRSSTYAGQECHGVRVVIDDPAAFRPVRAGLAIARALGSIHPDRWKAARVGELMGHRTALAALTAGKSLPEIEATWQADLARFKAVRAQYLVY